MTNYTTDDAYSALMALDPGAPRDEWVRIGMAAHAAGLTVQEWITWSQKSDRFSGDKDCLQQWKSFREGAVGAGTLFYLAREAGWEPESRDEAERHPARPAPRARAEASRPPPPPQDEAKLKQRRQRLDVLMAQATPADEMHPYLVRKEVNGAGLKMVRRSELREILGYMPEGKRGELAGDEILLAPFHDGSGRAEQVEMIDGAGLKLALALPRKGLMWSEGPVDREALTLGLCEGIATAKTLMRFRGHQVISSGTANNLPEVAERIRKLNPHAEIIVFADLGDDGQMYAQRAAEAVLGFVVSPPADAFEEPDGADFNDLQEVWDEAAIKGYLSAACTHPQRITFAQAEQIIPIDYALPSLPVGAVGLLVGPGSVGKSYLALELAISVTLAHNFLGVPGPFEHLIAGRTAMVFGEDDKAIVNNRMHYLAERFRLRPDDRERLDRDMLVLSLVGEDMRVTEVDMRNVREGPFLNRLRTVCQGRRLVFIDPLIRLHDSDENDNTAASHLMLSIQRIARDTRCAIVLLHHSGKGQVDGWAAARGASAITTTARWQLNATAPSKEEREKFQLTDDDARNWVKVDGVKMNYGENVRHFWLRRGAHGVLTHGEPSTVEVGGSSGADSDFGPDPFAGAHLSSPSSQPPRGYRSGR